MDAVALTRGSRGLIQTNQEQAVRFDLDIIDEVFEIRLTQNGPERVTAHRDYVNEWIYFTYTSDQTINKFPNQTLLYNYRDNSWAIFNESYTHYGNFRKTTGFTWQTVGTVYPSRLSDRKSTRLNSNHQIISYAVFCLKKKKNTTEHAVQC